MLAEGAVQWNTSETGCEHETRESYVQIGCLLLTLVLLLTLELGDRDVWTLFGEGERGSEEGSSGERTQDFGKH